MSAAAKKKSMRARGRKPVPNVSDAPQAPTVSEHHQRILQIHGICSLMLGHIALITEGHRSLSDSEWMHLAADLEGSLEAVLGLFSPLLEDCTSVRS